MGYDTDFYGAFIIEPPLSEPHWAYLVRFCGTRRMTLDAEKLARVSDPVREAVELPVGPDGAYYVASQNDHCIEGIRLVDQTEQEIMVDRNQPPAGQPSLWCDWRPSLDRRRLEWNGNEKTYESAKWLQYLITHFLEPWGYVVSGAVFWNGEAKGDQGVIEIRQNQVEERVDESLGVYLTGYPKLTLHSPADESERYLLLRDIGDESRKIIRLGVHPKYRDVATDVQHLGFYEYEGNPVTVHLSFSEWWAWQHYLGTFSGMVKPGTTKPVSYPYFQEVLGLPQSGYLTFGFQATGKLATDFVAFQTRFKELKEENNPRFEVFIAVHEKVAQVFEVASPDGCVTMAFQDRSSGFYPPYNKIGGYEVEDFETATETPLDSGASEAGPGAGGLEFCKTEWAVLDDDDIPF
ncbi:MAG: hypothetical protein K1Y36_20260 [Blastocatellia bacterium]|nr:hypothetical protein [Blastocatellia bacterium]